MVFDRIPQILFVPRTPTLNIGTHVKDGVERVSSLTGSDLVGLKAIHPLRGSEVPIISGDHVTSEAGTGVVHTAPVFSSGINA